MGDDAWLWKLDCEFRAFNYVGDTQWTRGEVTRAVPGRGRPAGGRPRDAGRQPARRRDHARAMPRSCSRAGSTGRCACPTRPAARHRSAAARSTPSAKGFATVSAMQRVRSGPRARHGARRGRCCGCTLARPEKRNAIDDTMMTRADRRGRRAGRDEAVRVIVLAGEGEHFCCGADIVARNAPGGGKRPRVGSIQRRLPSQAHRLIPLLATVQTPVVCAVQGWAAGIGLAMALAADFTIAAADARFWAPFCERGFTPDSGATWMLPRRVGEVRARQMVLLGRVVERARGGRLAAHRPGGASGRTRRGSRRASSTGSRRRRPSRSGSPSG